MESITKSLRRLLRYFESTLMHTHEKRPKKALLTRDSSNKTVVCDCVVLQPTALKLKKHGGWSQIYDASSPAKFRCGNLLAFMTLWEPHMLSQNKGQCGPRSSLGDVLLPGDSLSEKLVHVGTTDFLNWHIYSSWHLDIIYYTILNTCYANSSIARKTLMYTVFVNVLFVYTLVL